MIIRMPKLRCLRRAIVILIAGLAPMHVAAGQFRVLHAPARLHTGQAVNLFLEIESPVPFDGAYLAIPLDWKLRSVGLVSKSGRVSNVQIRKIENTANRYNLLPARRMVGAEGLVLGLVTGEATGSFSFRLTPFQLAVSGFESGYELLEDLSLRQAVNIEAHHTVPGNRVLEIREEINKPVSISNIALEDAKQFTVEFWIKTASMNSIVLSTWNGQEESSYPIEVVLDEAGHITFFRGVQGEHRSMRSKKPVSDGSWHHVAVSHSDSDRWSRLFIDGVSSDSLFYQQPLLMQDGSPLVLGGRVTDSQRETHDGVWFSGFIDEIRIWNQPRSALAIKTAMRQHIGSTLDVVQSVGFDEPEPGSSVNDLQHPPTVVSDLSFYEPIQNLEVFLDETSVQLQWQGVDPNVSSFLVERSSDGLNYQILDRIDVDAADLTGGIRSVSRYRDLSTLLGVAFYRIRQVFGDGMEIVSPAVKIGMGAEENISSGLLTGSFPNPFNPTTTITYELREAQHVQVSVWDLSGQMIALLVDANQDQGTHDVLFNGSELPSGNYFVRLKTVDGVQTHQMILMK